MRTIQRKYSYDATTYSSPCMRSRRSYILLLELRSGISSRLRSSCLHQTPRLVRSNSSARTTTHEEHKRNGNLFFLKRY